MNTATYTNELIKETSPYLQQHAHNPVEWFPWNEESLALAKKENKPILLSIGYSACHWCHVMAHESFENENIARVMNEHFINIKVDREERPDLDKIYQAAHQLITNKPGGWPLTMFLSSEDQLPFYAGTYFPSEARYQMRAFPDLLQQLANFYHASQNKIDISKANVKQALDDYAKHKMSSLDDISTEPFNLIRAELEQCYDSVHGGFGQAPKFPHFSNIDRLMHHFYLTSKSDEKDTLGLEMILHTLKKMISGGIYDHLGGGLCRYSVDEQWMIPHFEKMLYDNGPFLSTLCDAWQILSENNQVKQDLLIQIESTVLQTADWCLREMQSPEGGFYSTQDADSDGQEGKFYLWSTDEIRQVLEAEELFQAFTKYYGLDRDSNFEGLWNLHIYDDMADVAVNLNISQKKLDKYLKTSKLKLFEHRQKRVRPSQDEKILTSWNALMIKGLAKAGRIFKSQSYTQAAEKGIDFIHKKLWKNGRLIANYKDDNAHLPAYLDDYAFLLEALLELLQNRWRTSDLNWAIELAEILLTHFEDKENGGFYFTSHDHEQLITRSITFSDDSTASGNAIAASSLNKLGHILGRTDYIKSCENAVRGGWLHLAKVPIGHASMMLALEQIFFPPKMIVLRGKRNAIERWKLFVQEKFRPDIICLTIDDTQADLPEELIDKKNMGDVVAYVCSKFQCSSPITDYQQFIELIENNNKYDWSVF
ncbi:MAG: thioredoxin domain-containing protein [Gammaproteobacteria bacterium]|nr:thioredoxin domain-containing protein [Gammaproteobacteria bacterium]